MSEAKQQRLEYTKLAPKGMATMRAVEHYLNAESGLDTVLLELVRLRISLMNECAFCIGLHAHELRRRNEPEERIRGVREWEVLDAYTQRERVALRWAEVLTRIAGEVSDEEFAAVRKHFDDKELVDLSMAIASINAWNRLGVAFLPQWDESKAGGRRGAEAPGEMEQHAPERAAGETLQAEVTADEASDDEGKISTDEAGT